MPRTWNSSNSSSDENESDDQSYDFSHLCKELNKLKPYDYEPLASLPTKLLKTMIQIQTTQALEGGKVLVYMWTLRLHGNRK